MITICNSNKSFSRGGLGKFLKLLGGAKLEGEYKNNCGVLLEQFVGNFIMDNGP